MFQRIDWSEYRRGCKLGFVKGTWRKIVQLLARFIFFNQLRVLLYRLMGMRVGHGAYIGFDCYLDADYAELLTIHDRAIISFRVIMTAHDKAKEYVAPIEIKSRAFIGTGAIILPGVKIGEGAVVGAGAVVTKDVADGAVVAGNPAKLIENQTP